jgi:FkbM family methyltransferase
MERVDRFIDVGADLDFQTCLAPKGGKPVVAFEPQQQNRQCLLKNLRANGWEAEVFPLALAEQPRLLKLDGASGPSASIIKGWAGNASHHQTPVPVSTLDVVVGRRSSGEQLLIKIDVEGAERQVLGGASDTVGRLPKPIWTIEVCLDEFHPEGANPAFRETFQRTCPEFCV